MTSNCAGSIPPKPSSTIHASHTLANRWQLTSDDSGRLSGSYTFADADPLGDYELSIPGLVGTTRLSLAEYRKTKLNLRISGEREGTRLRLSFQAVDFMGKPLAAEKVQFTADIVRNPNITPPGTLQGKEFVHAPADKPASLRLEDLSEEEQLLAQVDPDFAPFSGANETRQPVVVAQVHAELALAGKSAGEYSLEIPKSCQEPGYAVVVRGIVTDTSGREQNKTQTIGLKYLSDQLKLSLPRRTFVPNEPIEVSVKMNRRRSARQGRPGGHAALVYRVGSGLRLSRQLARRSDRPDWSARSNRPDRSYRPIRPDRPIGFWRPEAEESARQPGRWQAIEQPEPERRRLVTAVSFEGDTAKLKLNEAGAYMLVAILERPDGSKLQQEIGCVVETPLERPGLTLQLDRTTLKSGDVPRREPSTAVMPTPSSC